MSFLILAKPYKKTFELLTLSEKLRLTFVASFKASSVFSLVILPGVYMIDRNFKLK